MPSIDFNPRSRWPFSAFFAPSTVPISSPSPPPNCSCNFLGMGFDQAHSHEQSFWHQCNSHATEFLPPSPQLSQTTPFTMMKPNFDTQDGSPSSDAQNSGIKDAVSDARKINEASGKTRSSEYLESGFFNKDGGISRSSSPTPSEAPLTNENMSHTGKHKDQIPGNSPDCNSISVTESSNPITPPNKTWRPRIAKTSTGDTNGNPTWLYKSTRPIDKPWRRDSAPVIEYSSLKPRSSGDRTGYDSSSKDDIPLVSNLNGVVPEPEPKLEPELEPELEPKPELERKTVLGCSQCLTQPKLKVSPCGCLICLNCGGRYWGAGQSGSSVYCGCGEVSHAY